MTHHAVRRREMVLQINTGWGIIIMQLQRALYDPA
jgi:hypothetical protein